MNAEGARGFRWTNVVLLLSALASPAAVAPWCATWHWSLDLLASFVVQATLWLGAATMALLAARRWRPATIVGATAAVGVSACAPTWWAPPTRSAHNSPQAGESHPQLRVLALNLLRENKLGTPEALAVIHRIDPDVLYCTEYTTHWQSNLRDALPGLPHRIERPEDGYFGAAIFSRLPLEQAEFVPLAQSRTPAARAVVRTPTGPVGILGVHPPPPGPTALRVAGRDAGLEAIAAVLVPLPERRVVLGDFNATPWQPAFAAMRTATGLGPGSTADWLPTWPAQLPLPLRIPIDHVLVGGPLELVEVAVGEAFGSDHLPIAATVRLRD